MLPQSLGPLALLLAAATFGSFGWLIRLMNLTFSPLAQVAFRSFVAAGILTVILTAARGRRKKFIALTRPQRRRALMIGALMAISIACFTFAVNHIPLAAAVALLYGGSLLTAHLLAIVVMHERPTLVIIASSFLTLLGLAMYADTIHWTDPWAWLALACGSIEAATNLVRKTLAGVPRLPVQWWQFVAIALACVAVMPFTGTAPVNQVHWQAIVVGIIFGVLLLAVSSLMLYGFAHTSLTIGTIVLTTEIFFAAFFGWVIYHEAPTTHTIIGALLIVMATALATLPARTNRQNNEPTPALSEHSPA